MNGLVANYDDTPSYYRRARYNYSWPNYYCSSYRCYYRPAGNYHPAGECTDNYSCLRIGA